MVSCEPQRRFFSFSFSWLLLLLEIATAAWAVSPCDDGHGAAAGCAQLLLPFADECLQLFGVLLQGIPESFELSWLAVWQNISVQAVQFWPLRDNVTRTRESGSLRHTEVSGAYEGYKWDKSCR